MSLKVAMDWEQLDADAENRVSIRRLANRCEIDRPSRGEEERKEQRQSATAMIVSGVGAFIAL